MVPGIGDEVGGYTLEKKIGAGGCGVVWLGFSKDTNPAPVAVKVVRPELLRHEIVRERFEREVRILERLEHPNIPRLLTWSTNKRLSYLVLQFVAGETLSQLMTRSSLENVPLEDALIGTIVRQVFDAVEYAHGHLVVHRDLKPGNIIVSIDEDDQPKATVLDFGISKIIGGDGGNATTVGRVLGSANYFSPEQARGEPVDLRTDICALGSILFELLTLRRAWVRAADGTPAVFSDVKSVRLSDNVQFKVGRRIIEAERPLPSAWRSDLPSGADEVVAKALARSREERYQDIAALRRDIFHIFPAWSSEQQEQTFVPAFWELQESSQEPTVAKTRTDVSRRRPRPLSPANRRKTQIAAVAALAVATAVLLGATLYQRARPPVEMVTEAPIVEAEHPPEEPKEVPTAVAEPRKEPPPVSVKPTVSPVVDRTSSEIKPTRRKARSKTRIDAEEEKIDPRFAGLLRAMKKTKQEPAKRFDLADRIDRVASSLPDFKSKRRIQRCTMLVRTNTNEQKGVAHLETCLNSLIEAMR